MRLAVLLGASALVAACSPTSGDEPSTPALTTPSTSVTSSASSRFPSSSVVPTTAPGPGSPIAAVIAWVEAGAPTDVADYHAATRDGVRTDLGADVAFTGPAGTPNCMTDARADGALACLVDLRDPPPRPAEVYGQWKGNWVDFDGPSVVVGSAHGDPGRFGNGVGAELPPGASLTFGDYRCRTDEAAVWCVDYAHRSAVSFAADGIGTFGCLRATPAPADVGRRYAC
ncbi:hypothetical protein [Mycolicibacterium grossiae]|uniref:LppI n=1 Tax=Mycolicibacterium grossiae TaxID=1552759 RepID=A0A1E8QB37_9MYCO|nr:hypothetical protein [Mycolicibacterium grossiae]OFJ55491.1 hypothetical protein BEL07_01820 [Mycolicibacterium grossiae]QEM47012.1 hypothetical protein FZ046_21525 [Mycolicibacterium grossiae]